MKKNETIEEHRVIEDAISEFGHESMKVAEMFLKLTDLCVVRIVTTANDPEPAARLYTWILHAARKRGGEVMTLLFEVP
jgi:hypothetical protein